MYLFLIFNNSFFFDFILAVLSFIDVGCYTVKLQIHVCCFNSCLLYMYTNGFFSTRSPNISYLHVLDRIKLKKYIDKFNKKVMSCKIH